MSRLYLVTGFLGAGKTTFLKKFVRIFSDRKLHLIINEFGREGVDGALLKELHIALDEVNNGSIFCSCRLDQFEEVLQNTLDQDPDVIVVEASGLSDPTNVRKILAQPGKFDKVEYMGSICLVDAVNFQKVYTTARVCKKQLGISDIVILNKTDLASPEQTEQARRTVLDQRPDLPVFETSFGDIRPEWLDALKAPVLTEEKATIHIKDINLQKFLITVRETFSYYDFVKFLEMFLEETFRVKGFVRLKGTVYLVDCVGNMVSVKPYEGETNALNQIVVLSGYGQPTGKALKKAAEWYPDFVEAVSQGE